MSYLIKERMLRDKSDQCDSDTSTDSTVTIEENFAGKKEGQIEQASAFVVAKKENVEVEGYRHFPADNIMEVWLNIFEKLDAEDKITISKTCHEMHHWVASKRTNFNFSEVVPILAQARYLPKEELLRCRQICKSWTSAINRVYPAHPSQLLLGTEIRKDVKENEISKLENRFRSADEIQRFLEEMHSHHGNPFSGRSIRLAYKPPEEAWQWQARRADRLRILREYYEKAIELLELYGFHLHMAEFDLWPCGSWVEATPMETYNYFRRCLLHVPNLKKLVVLGQSKWPYLDEDLAFYRKNTLPPLPQLETVWIRSASYPIWNGVLESSCVPLKVKRLFLRPAELERLRIPEAAYFPNLEAFEVFLPNEYLERFLNVSYGVPIPPVHTIELHPWGRGNKDDFRKVFKRLEAFGGSLTFLKFCRTFSEESFRDVIATGFVINLPRLERLEVAAFSGPLDPFSELSSLKFLTITWPRVRKWNRSRVDFYGFEECMEKSNVWGKIPSLQEFHVESLRPPVCKTYYRDRSQLSLDV